MEKDSDSFSMINDPKEDTKLLYSKSKVYVHPSKQDFIPGYLTIIDKNHDYLVAWTPETLMPNKESFVQVDYNSDKELASSTIVSLSEHSLYAFSSHTQAIQSILVTPPSFSAWYGQITINFKDGQTAGPFWFHDDESVSTVYQKKTQGGKLTGDDDSLRWGGEEFMDILSRLTPMNSTQPNLFILGLPESAHMDPFVATLKEARWNILEKLSQVTKFSRQAMDLFTPRDITRNETVRLTMDDYDSARIFLAKWAAGLADESEKSSSQRYRQVGIWGHEEETSCGLFEVLNYDTSLPDHTDPITYEQWSSWFDHQGRLDRSLVCEKIFHGGVDPKIRKEAWLFLTGVYPWQSTTEDRLRINRMKQEDYDSLRSQWNTTTAQFKEQKHRIEKDVYRTDRTLDFYTDPANLQTLCDILCTYNIYNTELGYVQGMSDLLSPLLTVMEQEHLAFWSFVGLMERMKSNFYKDQSGMHHQLLVLDHLLQFMDLPLYKHLQRTESSNFFFCFRWLLVLYKREFEWNDMLLLWETLWTDHLSTQFHLFIALAILDKHRDHIITYLQNFDEVLKYINDLSMSMDLQDILQRAEILFHQFEQRVEAVDSKREQHKESNLHKLPLIHPTLRAILSERK